METHCHKDDTDFLYDLMLNARTRFHRATTELDVARSISGRHDAENALNDPCRFVEYHAIKLRLDRAYKRQGEARDDASAAEYRYELALRKMAAEQQVNALQKEAEMLGGKSEQP